MTCPGKEIFLSYGRENETIYFLQQLKKDLKSSGFEVWLDSDDITAGSDWHGAIGTGLDRSRAIIAVITNKYINSNYCKGELYTADSDGKHIFPVFLEDVDLSASEMTRGVKYIISGINWTFFRPGVDNYSSSLAKLIEGMKEKGLGQAIRARKNSEEVDSGEVTSQLAQLHLSSAPDQPHPTAPPPVPQMPQPYGYYHQRPNFSPQPYYSQGPPRPYPQGSSPYYTSPPTSAYYQPANYQSPPPPPPGSGGSGGGGYVPYISPQQQLAYPHSQQGPYQQQQTPPPLQGPYTSPHQGPYASPPQQGPYTSPQQGPFVPPPYTSPYTSPPQQLAYGSHQQVPYASPPSQQAPYTPPLPPPPPPYDDGDQEDEFEKPGFKVGMKLEAVDQRFPYFVCVATVMDRNEDNDELLVHFDGWGPDYNYWCSREAVELHPAGWCERHGWDLQTPHNQTWENWITYLKKCDADKAPDELFSENQQEGPGSLQFVSGMKIEAKDNLLRMCVATIIDVKPGKVKVHFDGHGSGHDVWCQSSSTDIHPPMWCGKNQASKVCPPQGYGQDFKWNIYLSDTDKRPAPAHLFTPAQSGVTTVSNYKVTAFQAGMRVEAKDRINPSLTAVATIEDIKDERLLIHFDGWTSRYDYWCKPDCVDIHPTGWCERNNIILQSPNNHGGPFSWDDYLSRPGVIAAPKELFSPAQMKGPNDKKPRQFKTGMKLEAKDRSMICVATVSDVKSNGELLIHFDGWTTTFDYWCKPDSTDIHPRGWCKKQTIVLEPPHGYGRPFKWSDYLSRSRAIAAPRELFSPAQQGQGQKTKLRQFEAGMRLEAKDRKNPSMICVATVSDVKSNGELLIHFDGWTTTFDYWCKPDSTDIHPRGWCERNNHKLQPPHGYGKPFGWNDYLSRCSLKAAPSELFSSAQGGYSSTGFKTGMRLEAKDRKNPSVVCVATVSDVNSNGELLIHFDGWTKTYDYWCKPDSTDIHPRGWCQDNNKDLQKPNGRQGVFIWNVYLKECHAIAAPDELFTSSQRAREENGDSYGYDDDDDDDSDDDGYDDSDCYDSD